MATNPSTNGSAKRPSVVKKTPQPYLPSCTHLTMTRLYTADYRCTICGQPGAFGWLYRCTQDRELLLEEDGERGAFGDCTRTGGIFERSFSPLPRSPAARQDKFAFLSEVTPDQFSTYTPDQVKIILEQRAKVLEVAKAHSRAATQNIPEIFVTPPSSPGITPPASPPPQNNPRPWIPIPGGECQFKCCPRCRTYCRDRAWTSLVGVVKNDIPMTAITGFGFHMARRLPIGDLENVKNLGLRLAPQPKPKHTRDEYEGDVAALGIIDGIPRSKFAKKESRTSWPALTIKTHATNSGNTSTATGLILPTSGLNDQDHKFIRTFLENLPRTPTMPNQSSTSDVNHAVTGPKPDDENHASIGAFLESLRRAPPKVQDADNDSAKTLTNDDPQSPPLPPKILRRNSTPPATQSQQTFDQSARPNPLTSNPFPKRTLRPKPKRSNLNLAITPPLPSEPIDDLDDIEARRSLTPMEAKEANQGVFGKSPLDVGDGVAVMEEGVGGHFADLMDCEDDVQGEGTMGVRVVEEEVEMGMNEKVGEEINGLQINGIEGLMTQV